MSEKEVTAMIRVDGYVKDEFEEKLGRANELRAQKKRRKLRRGDLVSLMLRKTSDKDLLSDNY